MRRAFAIAAALVVVGAFASRVAPAATESDLLDAPSIADLRAGMCDGFDGLAFTFCVALCEARGCDLLPEDDDRCAILRRGFARVSGGATAPCLDGTVAQTL